MLSSAVFLPTSKKSNTSPAFHIKCPLQTVQSNHSSAVSHQRSNHTKQPELELFLLQHKPTATPGVAHILHQCALESQASAFQLHYSQLTEAFDNKQSRKITKPPQQKSFLHLPPTSIQHLCSSLLRYSICLAFSRRTRCTSQSPLRQQATQHSRDSK